MKDFVLHSLYQMQVNLAVLLDYEPEQKKVFNSIEITNVKINFKTCWVTWLV